MYEFLSGTVINLDHVVLVEPYKNGCRVHLTNGMNIKLPSVTVKEFIEDTEL